VRVEGIAFFFVSALVATPALADDAACVAATEQSLTLRQQGKLHAALKQLAVCADPACPAEVKEECGHRIADINAAMPSLIFAVKDSAGNDLDMITVTMDGAPLTSILDGRALTIDPGEHAFRFDIPGQPPIEKKLILREGEKDRREGITIGASTQLPPPSPPASFWNAQRALGAISGGLGIVGIGLGVWFGAFALSSQSQEGSDCPMPNCQHYLQSVTDYNYAQMNATASTVLFITGGVLAATGVVLWLTAPHVKVTPLAGPRTGGLSFGGEF
jgi:hypothetical protein